MVADRTDRTDSARVAKSIRKLQPARAFLLGLVLPGSGQIYNGEAWKLPIIVGTFLYLTHELRVHNQLHGYAQKGLTYIQDEVKGTENPFIWSESGLESRIRFYRRLRDFDLILLSLAYVLQAAEAYVSAHLSTFDVQPNLTHIVPFYDKIAGKGAVFGLACHFPITYSHRSFAHE